MNRRGFIASALAAVFTARRTSIDTLLGADHGHRLRRTSNNPVHPDPRPGVTGDRVLDTPAVRRKPRTAELYDMAREIPEIFDGLYCYCHCHDGEAAHRSLLTCFESEQPAGCYGCGATARVAYKAYKAGKTLDEIRAACDRAFG
jgi:hypothetical protein